jgi:Protein of unknown function (DUF3570)
VAATKAARRARKNAPDASRTRPNAPAGALLAAALALPGMLPAVAHAQAAPDQGIVQLNYLSYRDWQPGQARMKVESPSFYALYPVSDTLVVEGAVVYDAMSGASPLYFNVLSGASVGDYRTAGDLKVTKYFGAYSISVSGVVSSEQDFLSRGGAIAVQVYSDDRNRTWSFQFGGNNDVINPTNDLVVNAKRNTLEFMVGVTQNLSPTQVIQSNITYSTGHGYYDDPYKPLDTRPNHRNVVAWLTRYNQYFNGPDATLKLGYRLLFDSFGSVSNTFEASWVQALPWGFTVTPALRYYTQSAADFYMNPPFLSGFVEGQDYSADTRLAAFGAFTAGMTITKAFEQGWSVRFRGDFYRQQPSWRLGGSGSPGIESFSARWLELGLAKTF